MMEKVKRAKMLRHSNQLTPVTGSLKRDLQLLTVIRGITRSSTSRDKTWSSTTQKSN